MAGITPVSFTNPYSAEELDIQRRQKMAEMLQQQAITPLGNTEVAPGGWAVRRSPTEGLAKIFGGGLSGLMATQTDEKRKELIKQMQADRQSSISQAMSQAQGAPSSTDAADNFTPQQAPNPMGAMQVLARSNDPMLQQAGTAAMLQNIMPKEPKYHENEEWNASQRKIRENCFSKCSWQREIRN